MATTLKRAWKDQRKPKQLRGKPLNPSAALEMRYYHSLAALIRVMTSQVEAEVHRLFVGPEAQQFYAQDNMLSSQARMMTNEFIRKFQRIFNLAAKPIATRMTAMSTKQSALSLNESLKHLSNGLTLKTDVLTDDLKEILSATITENVGLIKSIPADYLTQVQGAVMRSITTGNGLQDLVPFLQKQENITLRRARIIARDQTRKVFSNINFARMNKLGITEYEWLHSAGGQTPRKLHIAYSGRIFRIDEPPIIDEKTGVRGKPGDLINCRCRAVPVVKFEDS